jgi:hypothetical protein
MKNNILLIFWAALTFLLASCTPFFSSQKRDLTTSTEDFTNTAHALAVFQGPSSGLNASIKAKNYLIEHSEESTDPLLEIVTTRDYSWQTAGHALAKTKNDKVLYTFIELLADNLFETEADGSRRPSPKGVSYGGNIAEFLGEMGDERAVPSLWNAVEHGDRIVRWNALEALYYLGDLSMDQLFEMSVSEGYHSTGHVILSIASNDAHPEPAFILTVLDRFIETFPGEEFEVSLAHRYKMRCYDYLGKYDEALREADIVFEMLGYLPSPTKKHKERIWNKMIALPTATWSYVNAGEDDAECSLSLSILFKTNEVKVSSAYTSFFKSHSYSDTGSHSTHTLPQFPIETGNPQSNGDHGTLEKSHSSFCVSGITETGIVARVEFEYSSPNNNFNCDVDHSILIPFGGTGRCKKDDVLYRWKWANLQSRQSTYFIAPRDVLVVPDKKASGDAIDQATGLTLVGKWKAVFEPNIEVIHWFRANGAHVHEMLGGDMKIDGVWEVVGDTLRIKSGDIVLLGSKQKSSTAWVEHKIIYHSQEELHTQLEGRPVVKYVRMK